ncbi:MAG: MucB/RseB C-terminal domain-containing protein [Thiohalomonadaceae bacterium]
MRPGIFSSHGLLLALFLSQIAWAEDVSGFEDISNPQQWLERMSEAAHQLNYDGTFVYFHDGHMQAMRIVHSNNDGVERERLLSLSGPVREVLRDSERVICILPDDNAVVEENAGPSRRRPLNLPARLETLLQYYDISDADMDRVAGHNAHKILITPKDDQRYGHAFWLHQQKGLLLRSELYNEEGRVVEQLMFTGLKFYEQVPEELLAAETHGRDVIWQRGAPKMAVQGTKNWWVSQLPAGFVLENHRRHVMSGNIQVEHLLFSDGLASVSVFIEPMSAQQQDLVDSLRLGAVNTYRRHYLDHVITVMGEVPSRTAQRIGEAVQRIE